jgi:hypothetical protein
MPPSIDFTSEFKNIKSDIVINCAKEFSKNTNTILVSKDMGQE